MADGQVVFEISADGKKAYAAINDITEALGKAGKNWESNAGQSTDAIGNKFTSMFKKIGIGALAAKAGKALLDLGKDALQAASDLDEVQNVVDVTFGASGAQQIEDWAKTASSQFGLTELQAKRFTSTLGAMMKSSGLAGDEIIGMSTDLAGLAADMASFYNLDFDTAFQKIRAGISGETEPLKQLGINMSVANLEAYALTQGISKSFNEMSQGEQTMLRYQYLMQATSDAQGDFARTSADSFANMKRQLETNFESIKASIGQYLLGPMKEVTEVLNTFLGDLIGEEKPRTILDEIADINIQKELKIADIEAVADKANGLLLSLDDISGKLGPTSTISSAFGEITTSINGLDEILGDNTIGENATNLAGELNPPVNDSIADTLEDITGRLEGSDADIKGSQSAITEDVNALAEGLDPEVNATVADDVHKMNEDLKNEDKKVLENKIIDEHVSELADGLNPTVESTIADTAHKMNESLNTEDSAVQANKIDEHVSKIAEGLDPDVDKTIANTVADVNKGLAAEDTKLDKSGIPGSVDKIAEGLNPPVDENIAKTVAGISEELAAEDKRIQGVPIPSDVKTIADGLNPTPARDGELVEDLGDIVTEIGKTEDKLNGNTVGEGITNLADELNPPDVETIAGDLGGVEEAIDSLDNKLDDNGIGGKMKTLAGDLNPPVEGDFAGTVTGIADGVETLKTKVDAADGVGTKVEEIAKGINTLDAGSPDTWRGIFNALQKVDGLENIFTAGAAGNVESLALALSGNAPDESKAAAWQTFLDALGTNADALSKLTGKDAEGTAEWLATIGDAATKLTPTDAESWNKLLTYFVAGVSGLGETEEGKSFLSALTTEFLAMGSESDIARAGLAALGYETDDISRAQDTWLGICQELVKTIPELASIINTETGAVKGGTEAVQKYIDAWRADKIIQARIDALKAQKEAIERELNYDWDLEIAKKKSEYYAALRAQGMTEEDAKTLIKAQAAGIAFGDNGYFVDARGNPIRQNKTVQYADPDEIKTEKDKFFNAKRAVLTPETQDALAAWQQAEADAETARNNTAYALEEYDAQLAELEQELGQTREEILGLADAEDDAAKNATTLEKAANGDADAMASVEEATKAAADALQDLADYQEKVRQETEQSVNSVIKGFDKIETPMQKARNELQSLKQAWEDAKTAEEKAAALEKWNKAKEKYGTDQVSVASMTAGLRSQLNYMQQYQDMLDKAREKGVSEDILASLSDGSQESFDYLYALTQFEGNIEELNDLYAQVQTEAEGFTNTLTDQKLAVDEVYQDLVATAQEAVQGLNLSDEAYEGVSETLDAILQACGEKSDSIKNAVENIIAQMDRLSSLGAGGWLTNSGMFIFRNGTFGMGSHDNGLDYVPYDGYLALLHQGERVQTAAEADLARRYSYQQPTFDYTAMGGAIGANIGRGNVYLDGRVVGELMSARQANSYRALERSGWQG